MSPNKGQMNEFMGRCICFGNAFILKLFLYREMYCECTEKECYVS